jgi:acetyltransferase-like isoleucine patch superfamily enzyme
MLGMVIQLVLFPLPWRYRRWVLRRAFGYRIARSAHIGYSLVLAGSVELADGASIGHLTILRGMDYVSLAQHASIGPLNRIYAIQRGRGFFEQTPRRAELILERGATITSRHVVDCSAAVHLGRQALVAGYHSQILTHSVNLSTGRQGVRPISIEEGCLVGSSCIILGGSRLPHHSALVAGSTLRHSYTTPYRIYAGVVAIDVGAIEETAGFFHRPLTGPW